MVVFALLAISPVLVFPVELIFALKIYTLLGIRRLTKRGILDHEHRRTIYEIIREKPGLHLSGIVHESGLNRGTIKYHLAVLEMTGKINRVSASGFSMYYKNHDSYTEMEKKILWHLKSDSRSRIMQHLLNSSSGTRHEIADTLGVSRPTVTWHMQRLIRDEIVSLQKDGKNARYGLTPDAAPVIRNYLALDKTSSW
jgi:predicted transcriptional regulator